MTSATLDLPMSADFTQSSHNDRFASEEDLYVAITRAWFGMFSRGERRKRPLCPYVFSRGFVRSVADAPVDGLLVALVCAHLACCHIWRRDGGESLPLKRPPLKALDQAAAWWRAFEDPGGLGVHYVELGCGILEFLSVAHRDDRPSSRGLDIGE